MLLLDSGAQYLDGTTDITRTIVLGALTKEEKRLHISLKRIYPTLNGSISTWNLRNTTRCAGPPPYVESRNQLPAWNRPRCRLFPECTRRSSPIPHEPHASLTCSRHDSNQRAPVYIKPAVMEYVRKIHVNCSVTRDRIRYLL